MNLFVKRHLVSIEPIEKKIVFRNEPLKAYYDIIDTF